MARANLAGRRWAAWAIVMLSCAAGSGLFVAGCASAPADAGGGSAVAQGPLGGASRALLKRHRKRSHHRGNDDDDDDAPPAGGGAGCAACWPDAFGWVSWVAAAALVLAPISLSAWLGLKLHRRLLLATAR